LRTRVGRGTPMGDFMRQFWIPACLSSEIEPDGPPMRLMLPGEKYPTDRIEHNRVANAWVPIDGSNTMIFNIDLQRASGRANSLRHTDGAEIPGMARPVEYLSRTDGWTGRRRSAFNRSNDHGIDRGQQRRGESFSDIRGIPLQDQAAQENMGPIVDRTRETLASSDLMVVLTRRALLHAAQAHQETGQLPAVLDDPSLCHGVRGGDLLAAAGTHWLKAYDDAVAAIARDSARAAE
jgi:phthalate 4,5-dioxygenase